MHVILISVAKWNVGNDKIMKIMIVPKEKIGKYMKRMNVMLNLC